MEIVLGGKNRSWHKASASSELHDRLTVSFRRYYEAYLPYAGAGKGIENRISFSVLLSNARLQVPPHFIYSSQLIPFNTRHVFQKPVFGSPGSPKATDIDRQSLNKTIIVAVIVINTK